MNAGGRRQLPSWMARTTAIEQASTLETQGENKENGYVKPHAKVVEPLKKKAQAKKQESGLKVLRNCEARMGKRKSNKHEEGQDETFQEDDSCLLKPCKKSRNTRMATKNDGDQVDDFFESDKEKKKDDVGRKRVQNKALRMNFSEKLIKDFQDVKAEFGPSEDELTVEDLVSIAEEHVKADRTESQKSKIERDAKTLHRAGSQFGLEKHLTAHRENSSVTDKPLLSVTKPSSGEGRITDLSNFDPTRDMLDLLLGPSWRQKSEVERKTDAVTEKFVLDYELNKKSHNDSVAEVAPVLKKKISLKDKIQSFLD